MCLCNIVVAMQHSVTLWCVETIMTVIVRPLTLAFLTPLMTSTRKEEGNISEDTVYIAKTQTQNAWMHG